MLFEELFLSLLGSAPMTVEEIEEDCVVLNNRLGPLYGIKVTSNTERAKVLGADAINRLMATDPSDNKRLLFLVLKRFEVAGRLHSELYYFTHSKEVHSGLLTLLKKAGRELKGWDIANVLASSLLLRSGILFDQKELKIYEDFKVFSEKDMGVPVREKFLSLVKEVNTNDYRVYVASGLAGRVDWERLFRIKFQGVLYIMLDLNDPLKTIKLKKSVAQRNRRVWQEMEEDYAKGEKPVGLYVYFVTRESLEKASDVFYSLGLYCIEKHRMKPLFALGGLNYKDESFLFLVSPDIAGEYLLYGYEKTDVPKSPEVYGKNRYGSFVAFSPFEENQNPHVIVFAPSGAGKSFGIQNYVSILGRINVKELFEGTFTQNVDVRLRYFDKGYSAELFFKLLKARGYDVAIFSSSLDNISLNPVQIDSPEVEELEFSVSVVNACLEALDIPPLTGFEVPYFMEALKKIAKNPNLQIFRSHQLSVLRRYPSLLEVYKRAKELGFKETDYVGELPEEFNFLKVPILDDVIRELSPTASSASVRSQEREAIKSLLQKISVLAKQPMLSCPTQVDVRADKIVYLDFEALSKSRFFVPIVLTLLNILVREDKYNKPENVKVYYVIDEAHNMLRNEHFNKALKVLTREARKFRMAMIYLTQFFEEIPPEVIFNVDTIMFLSPQEEQKRRQYLNNFYAHVKNTADERLDLRSDLEYVYDAVPPYTFVTWYSQGVFSLSLEVDPVKLMVFDSYRKSITTPDGLRITKSTLKEEA